METHVNLATADVLINAPVDKVWDALVNPEKIRKYMFGAEVSSGWKAGDPITWKGEWEGKPYEDRGKILKVKPGEVLQYSHYSPVSGDQDFLENYHTITVELIPQNERTSVIVTQDNNASIQIREKSEKNWKMMLEAMKNMLEGKSK